MKSQYISILLTSILLLGCGGYGAVSDTTYQHAKSLYTITNRQLDEPLDALERSVNQSAEEGAISAREADWLKSIIADARQKRWSKAMSAARRIMEDQIDH